MRPLFAILFLILSFEINAQKSDFEHIDFEKADSIAKSYGNASLQNMPLLVHNLTYNLNTQVEQFRAIHTWVCLNIESDHYFSETTLKKRRKLHQDTIAFNAWNSKVQKRVFKKLVNDKKTLCSGYAYVVKTLANIADIECETVDGYARTVRTNTDKVDFPNHSWNVVKLNGKWYFVDTTQASGFYNLDDQEYVKNYNDGYFLAEPELFAKNHFPLDEKWLLLKEETSLKEFISTPIIYGKTYKYGVIPQTPSKLVSKIRVNDEVVFQFKLLDEAVLNNISIVLTSGLKYKKIMPTLTNFKNGVLELKYRFDKRGHYDVHAKVGKEILVSYTIIVEKSNKDNL